MAELFEAETFSLYGFGSAMSMLDGARMFSSNETEGRFCF